MAVGCIHISYFICHWLNTYVSIDECRAKQNFMCYKLKLNCFFLFIFFYYYYFLFFINYLQAQKRKQRIQYKH